MRVDSHSKGFFSIAESVSEQLLLSFLQPEIEGLEGLR